MLKNEVLTNMLWKKPFCYIVTKHLCDIAKAHESYLGNKVLSEVHFHTHSLGEQKYCTS